MAEETQTVSGEVVSVTPWKSGKGSWVNLQDNSTDFFAFKAKVPKVKETGTWVVKEGTGVMSDKVELVKPVKETTLNEKIDFKKKEEVKEFEKLAAKGDDVYFDKQNLIIRQSSMKSAAVLAAAYIQHHKELGTKAIFALASDLADSVYAWVTESDQKLPEPPEEP